MQPQAAASTSGVVNIYDAAEAMGSPSTVKPLKSIMNITTRVDTVRPAARFSRALRINCSALIAQRCAASNFQFSDFSFAAGLASLQRAAQHQQPQQKGGVQTRARALVFSFFQLAHRFHTFAQRVLRRVQQQWCASARAAASAPASRHLCRLFTVLQENSWLWVTTGGGCFFTN